MSEYRDEDILNKNSQMGREGFAKRSSSNIHRGNSKPNAQEENAQQSDKNPANYLALEREVTKSINESKDGWDDPIITSQRSLRNDGGVNNQPGHTDPKLISSQQVVNGQVVTNHELPLPPPEMSAQIHDSDPDISIENLG